MWLMLSIMDSMPGTPDPQTRTEVTRRIIAHATLGWPRLGEPIVRHRGQFWYVSALLPGHREPTPILRLRYQGLACQRPLGHRGSTWPAAASAPNPSCPLPSAPRPAPRRRGR